MAIVQFNSFPVANVTGCDLILTPLWGTVGCGNHLRPGGADVWNCASDGLIATTWGGAVYAWVTPDTFNPPSFGSIVTCTERLILLVAWLHWGDPENQKMVELEANPTGQFLGLTDAPQEWPSVE